MPTSMTGDEVAWMKAIAKRVRFIRAERDWTQDDLAALSSLTRNKVSAIERSADHLRVFEINRIARAAGMDLAEILDDAP